MNNARNHKDNGHFEHYFSCELRQFRSSASTHNTVRIAATAEIANETEMRARGLADDVWVALAEGLDDELELESAVIVDCENVLVAEVLAVVAVLDGSGLPDVTATANGTNEVVTVMVCISPVCPPWTSSSQTASAPLVTTHAAVTARESEGMENASAT